MNKMSRMLTYLLGVMFSMITLSANAVELGTTKGSANYQTGIALAKTLNAGGVDITPIPHRGTNIYLEKVDNGKIEFGLCGVYMLGWGYEGYGPVKKPHKNLRFVANLQHFRTAIVVRNNSDIKSYADLKAKKIPAGFFGAPAFQWMIQFNLANGGLTWDDVIPVPVSTLGKSWVALANKDVDMAMIALGGGPDKKYNTVVKGGLRALSVESGQPEKDMLENWGGVEVITLEPDPSLPSIRGTTRVHKFAYQLFTHKDVPNEVVRDVVLALHKNAETFRKASGFTKSFDETNMHNYDLVPMHEGAIEAYETLGLSK